MSSRAPISGNQNLRDQLSKADSDADFGYILVKINFDDNSFQAVKYVAKEQDEEDTALFKRMAADCVEKEHCYFIIRDPIRAQQQQQQAADAESKEEAAATSSSLNLYILVHFAPDLSPVKQRMIYASSRPSLKTFLGHSSFSEDYHCSATDELTLQAIVSARTLHHKIDFRSDAEIEKEQASLESVATAAKSAVMASLPVDVRESAVSAVAAYKAGESRTVLLTLDAKSQGIDGAASEAQSVAEICALLSEEEPKYILFTYAKTRQDEDGDAEEKAQEQAQAQAGEKRVFCYFCPAKADRKRRFTFSTCKANVIEYCASVGVDFYAKVELTTREEFSAEVMDYHVFPKQDKKEQFAMPAAPKSRRKGKGRRKGSKKLNLDDL